jgi:hypothetical protein
MRRIRKDATKVWHNPELNTFSRNGGGNGGVARAPTDNPEDRRSANQHRAALEALFAPKRDPEPDEARPRAGNGSPSKPGGRIVLAPAPQSDPRAMERQKLLHKLLLAEGRPKISKAADDFVKAGFTLPEEQDVYLQLLEHAGEEHVRTAIDRLTSILAGELPKRRAVLESRLRRIEQFAEEAATREAAERLRRRVGGRAETRVTMGAEPPTPRAPAVEPSAEQAPLPEVPDVEPPSAEPPVTGQE